MRILEVVGLTKRFAGLTALDAVSFTAEEGQILGLFGPNGAGKTTCFHCLSGFARPDAGRVIFDGREITGQTPDRLARAGLARTFQIVKPFRDLTAAENVIVALGHRHYGGFTALVGSWRGSGTRRRALELLERVGLTAEADRKAGLLTLGMLKRLEVARALALEPRLILLDEPLGGLSHEEMSATADLIADLRAQGLTVILVEHQMRIAMSLVDRVVVLDHGALIASGPPERVRADPRVIEAYLGEDAVARSH
ncbi:MAG TPA: ABC transporter ATP-binding protein [Methylomirabilota bacterium]|jgi:branched-chain amino acid transport system ATP-binding protein|nr:ABC transporter ATP-binding protein [Methylomirabilota bacterium]